MTFWSGQQNMPYQITQDLPGSIQHTFLINAQRIYLDAFDLNWHQFQSQSQRVSHAHRSPAVP